MSNFSGPPSSTQPYRPQQPHIVIPDQTQTHSDAGLIFTKTNDLISHHDFELHSRAIQTLLEADEQSWNVFLFVRFQIRSTLLRDLCPSIYCCPPREILDSVKYIREHKRWDTARQEIVERVVNARRSPASSGMTSYPSAHRSAQSTHLTPATASTRSLSRDCRPGFPYHHEQSRPRSGSTYQSSNRGPGSSCAAESPTPTQGHTTNHGRTAPEGYLFFCPSKNCKKSYPRRGYTRQGRGYTRQGHYENHMNSSHAEWPDHEASTSLRPIRSHEQADSTGIAEDSGMQMATQATWSSEFQHVFAATVPHSTLPSLPERGNEPASTLNPDAILHDIRDLGTQPSVSRSLLDSFLMAPYTPITHDDRFDLLDTQDRLLPTPSSRMNFQFTPPFPPGTSMDDL